MANFGAGVYLLTVAWFLTLMLCWVTVRTGHCVGKLALLTSGVLTITLVSIPKGDIIYDHSANFFDKLYVIRYSVLALLLASVVIGSVYGFVHVCLTPVKRRKLKSFGTVN